MNHQWLHVLSSSPKTAEEKLIDSLADLPEEEMQKLAWEENPSSRPTQLQMLKEKLATAERQGRELAHENNQLQKIAFVPALLSTAGKALTGGGAKSLLGGVAKDMAIGTAGSKLMGALKPAAPAAASAGEVAGGFKYASLPIPGVGRQIVGFLHRNPGAALTAGGAALGAAMAPRDPQTGQKHYMQGAMLGGIGAAGANALTSGRMADNMKRMITRQNNPLLGQGVRRYMTESALATRPGGGGAAAAMGRQAAPAPTSSMPDMTAHVTPPAPSSGEQAIRNMPQPTSPQWSAAHTGVRDMRERQSILNQFNSNNSLPTPKPANFRVYGR